MQPLKYWSSVCANKWSPWYFAKSISEMLKNETRMLSSVLENWEDRLREAERGDVYLFTCILYIDRVSNGCKWGRGIGKTGNISVFTPLYTKIFINVHGLPTPNKLF